LGQSTQLRTELEAQEAALREENARLARDVQQEHTELAQASQVRQLSTALWSHATKDGAQSVLAVTDLHV